MTGSVYGLFVLAFFLNLFLSLAVFHLKRKIYQSWNIRAPLRELVRHPAFPALGLVLLALYVGFLLPAVFDKCFWKQNFLTRYFLSTVFFVVQPAFIFFTFYIVEKKHILQKATGAAFKRAHAWVVATNVLVSCVLSALFVFMWMVLTIKTDYSVLKAMAVICDKGT